MVQYVANDPPPPPPAAPAAVPGVSATDIQQQLSAFNTTLSSVNSTLSLVGTSLVNVSKSCDTFVSRIADRLEKQELQLVKIDRKCDEMDGMNNAILSYLEDHDCRKILARIERKCDIVEQTCDDISSRLEDLEDSPSDSGKSSDDAAGVSKNVDIFHASGEDVPQSKSIVDLLDAQYQARFKELENNITARLINLQQGNIDIVERLNSQEAHLRRLNSTSDHINHTLQGLGDTPRSMYISTQLGEHGQLLQRIEKKHAHVEETTAERLSNLGNATAAIVEPLAATLSSMGELVRGQGILLNRIDGKADAIFSTAESILSNSVNTDSGLDKHQFVEQRQLLENIAKKVEHVAETASGNTLSIDASTVVLSDKMAEISNSIDKFQSNQECQGIRLVRVSEKANAISSAVSSVMQTSTDIEYSLDKQRSVLEKLDVSLTSEPLKDGELDMEGRLIDHLQSHSDELNQGLQCTETAIVKELRKHYADIEAIISKLATEGELSAVKKILETPTVGIDVERAAPARGWRRPEPPAGWRGRDSRKEFSTRKKWDDEESD